MFQTVFPVLPALIIAHAWITIVMAHTLSEFEGFAMPPEAFPA